MPRSVATSLRLALMPTSRAVEPVPVTSILLRFALRVYYVEQSPQERYSVLNSLTAKLEMFTVPGPLCWKTLSAAFLAPPPVTV